MLSVCAKNDLHMRIERERFPCTYKKMGGRKDKGRRSL